MYEVRADVVIAGELPAVWAVVTDVGRWPEWDPHEDQARLDGEFVVGTTGWVKQKGNPAAVFTLTEVVPERRWASECRLPGGKLWGSNDYEALPGGRIRCTRTVRVTGPLVPLFRFHFGRKMRRDFFRTWSALEQRAKQSA
jgi:polyketide cyclase/dehydrase/lipid transport protein